MLGYEICTFVLFEIHHACLDVLFFIPLIGIWNGRDIFRLGLHDACDIIVYIILPLAPGPRFNITTVFLCKYSHYKDTIFVIPSYLYDGNTYTGKITYLYWYGPSLFIAIHDIQQPIHTNFTFITYRNTMLQFRWLICHFAVHWFGAIYYDDSDRAGHRNVWC